MGNVVQNNAMVPNVLFEACPSRAVFELVANKWTILVMHALGEKTLRYAELQKVVDGISQKMLTQTLRGLERDGLVERIVYPVVPPKVEYKLTHLGLSLLATCNSLTGWSENHLHEVITARENYDKAQATS